MAHQLAGAGFLSDFAQRIKGYTVRHKSLTLLIICALCVLVGTLHGGDRAIAAPAKRTPLLVVGQNDANQWGLWGFYGSEVTNTKARLLYEGNPWMPIVSPSGEFAAYLVYSPAYFRQYQAFPGQPTATNLIVQNLTTGDRLTLSSQPKRVTPDPAHLALALHSDPSWSPDGKHLAWTQIVTDHDAGLNVDMAIEQLVIYDVATAKYHFVVARLPDHFFYTDGGKRTPSVSAIAWGAGGIAVEVRRADFDGGPAVYIYSPSGSLIAHTDDLGSYRFASGQMVWVKVGNADYIGNIAAPILIDPATGSIYHIPGTLELYNSASPNGLSMFFGSDPGNDATTSWLIARAGVVIGSESGLNISSNYGAVISPDGTQIANVVYQGQGTQGGVQFYHDGNYYALNMPDVAGISWGVPAWRVRLAPGETF